MVFVFGLQCLEPKNKGQMNVYECCDLTKKVYLTKLGVGLMLEPNYL